MTPHAFVLLPLGVCLLLFSRKWLYRFLIASTVFSATAVFNVGSGDNASGVQVWMFFGSLWLLREAVSRLATGDLNVRRDLLAPLSLLSLFVLIVSLSLIMPAYINGSLQIASPYLFDPSTSPLYFSTKNITGWVYVALGSLLAFSIAQENDTPEKLRGTARIYLLAGAFVTLWGFFQLACAVVGVTYPAAIFNNSLTPSAMGFNSVLPDVSVLRMSSVAVEPSLFSEVLLTIIPLTVPAMLNCGYVISRRADRVCFVLFALALLLSTSSTAYLGLASFCVLSLGLAVRMKILDGRATLKAVIWLGLGIPACFLGLYATVPLFRSVMDFSLFSKSSSYSALERLMTVQNAWSYFLQYPLLGIGWGSVGSHDTVVKLLANVGVLGLASFLAFLFWIASRLLEGVKGRRDGVALTQMVWLLSLTMVMMIDTMGGFSHVFGHLWLVLAMAMASAVLTQPGTLEDRPVEMVRLAP
ncbi:MAG TPA: hypothetical protein VGD59_04505 [Acidisarcina sp.]